MNNLKLIFIAVFTMIGSARIAAQERGGPELAIYEKKSKRLIEATGWAKNYNGIWIDNKNSISTGKVKEADGHEDNFYWIQTYQYRFRNKVYYALTYQSREGSYEYPLTQVNWSSYNMVHFLIFDSAGYFSLKSIFDKKQGVFQMVKGKCSIGMLPDYRDFDGDDLLTAASTTLRRMVSSDTLSAYSVCVNSQTLKGQDIVRFSLPNLGVSGCDFVQDRYYEAPADIFGKLFEFVGPKAKEEKSSEENAKMQAKVSQWTTSDTLFGSQCKAINQDGSVQLFDWACFSSFISEGKIKYCFYFKGLSLFGKPSFTFLLYDADLYNKLKKAASQRDNKIFQASARIFYTVDASMDFKESIYEILSGQVLTEGSGCLSINSGKASVQFFTPYSSSCNDKADFGKNDVPNHYQCDADAFARLFTLP